MNQRMIFSVMPEKYAAEAPIMAARNSTRKATAKPMTNDLRRPRRVMANRSNPPWLVPNQCVESGGVRKA